VQISISILRFFLIFRTPCGYYCGLMHPLTFMSPVFQTRLTEIYDLIVLSLHPALSLLIHIVCPTRIIIIIITIIITIAGFRVQK